MCSCRASSEAAPPRMLQLVLSTVQPPHTRPSSTMPRPQMSPAAPHKTRSEAWNHIPSLSTAQRLLPSVDMLHLGQPEGARDASTVA